jgi:hypothetical protein
VPRGGHRANAGRPRGARTKPKATARPRPSAARMARAKKMDSLQLTMAAARELYAKGEVAEAGKMAARAMPYTVQRYRPWHGDAPRSDEQQLALDLPMPAAIAAEADEAKPDKWKNLLN